MEIAAARPSRRLFPAVARWCERQVAHPAAAVTAVIFVALWLAASPFVAWSNGWQLIINTTSSVITLVMVFAISHTQRRDTPGHTAETRRVDPGERRGA
ncbi:MAG: low affinity iron permease family protein [Alphaproteobacteria bacterium]|nr:low affinity iron permease family protein [Alphaproteobacteria bacterium]